MSGVLLLREGPTKSNQEVSPGRDKGERLVTNRRGGEPVLEATIPLSPSNRPVLASVPIEEGRRSSGGWLLECRKAILRGLSGCSHTSKVFRKVFEKLVFCFSLSNREKHGGGKKDADE